jgi:hypothetical protein
VDNIYIHTPLGEITVLTQEELAQIIDVLQATNKVVYGKLITKLVQIDGFECDLFEE